MGEQFPQPLGARTTPWASRVCRTCSRCGSQDTIGPKMGLSWDRLGLARGVMKVQSPSSGEDLFVDLLKPVAVSQEVTSDMCHVAWGLSIVLLAMLMVGSAGANAPAPAAGIYVADTGNNRIFRIDDMTGAGWTTFGSQGTGVGQFSDLDGIFVGPTGQIFVADSDRIVRMDDMTGAGRTTFGDTALRKTSSMV